jgi:hypothetical protein
MKLEEIVDLMHRSSQRLIDALELPRDRVWFIFMRRESWIHLKQSLKLWLALRLRR